MADKPPVIVFFGDIMIHIDEDQAAALLMRRQIIKCPDKRHMEHYHLLPAAELHAIAGRAIDLRPGKEAMPLTSVDVDDMLNRATKSGGAN